MNDIVEQLRASVTQCRAVDRSALLAAAADEIERLRLAIRRLAEQYATLSACGGAVTVTVDATLTDAEREAVDYAATTLSVQHLRTTLRGLLERTQAD